MFEVGLAAGSGVVGGFGLGWVLGFGVVAGPGEAAGFEVRLATGFGRALGTGSALVGPGLATEVRTGLGSGAGEACGFEPSTVVLGAGPGVESMPLTLLEVGGGTGLGCGLAAGSGEFGLVLALEPWLVFGVRTASGDGFAPAG
ncbi:hypothetical protein G3I59_07035 [Amycolatopsis rubida]|uniref:Elastin n=1 Tax=Amycolatopsis rubida TaxID=112413 RepID=A0ABX0BKC0_9PSEU|nr:MULTISPECIES: hypothetical protein [Amycolatopsis]MYW90382.1 hypothetical protein [Amycolatopsis rubida]NEC55359.1 hypothetical protein [Amycolatopsis rubida]